MSYEKNDRTAMRELFDEEFYRSLATSLLVLKKCFLVEDHYNTQILDLVDSYISPRNGRPYSYNQKVESDNFDPMMENIVERATSGLLSYHFNPSEPFFRFYNSDPLRGDKKITRKERTALSERTEMIHRVIQSPENFSVIAAATRDKLVRGITAKTLDPHPVRIGVLQHYPFEQIAIGTSNGKVLDIFGVRETLDDFQAKARFPKILSPHIGEGMAKNGLMMGGKKTYYRFCLPITVLRRHLIEVVGNGMVLDEKVALKYIKKLLPKQKNEDKPEGNVPWADIWFCNEGLLTVDIKDYRPIIVSQMSPPYRVCQVTRGQAEKALPLIMVNNFIVEMGLNAFEKTYGASISIMDEQQKMGMDLTPNGINFREIGTEEPKYISLNANMQGVIEFKQYQQAAYERMFYIDVFDLINKSRMPSNEVALRDTNNFRKLVLYLCQDQADDLNPMALGVNSIYHSLSKENDELSKMVLGAKYISALAFANKNSLFDKFQKILQLSHGLANTMALDTPLSDEIDLLGYFEDIMDKAGEIKLFLKDEVRNQRKEERARRQRLAVQKEEAGVLRETTDVIQKTQGNMGQQGPGPGQGQIPNQNPRSV